MIFGKTKLGKMAAEVLRSFFKKPATVMYPAESLDMPDKFRGQLVFYHEKCIGCKLCMKDCPTNAINIKKLDDGSFAAEIDLDKCIYCAQCVYSCPKNALEATKNVELAHLDKKKMRTVLLAGHQEQAQK